MQIGDNTIITTPTHPFWVEGYGFKAAGELKAGDLVQTAEGALLTVTGIEKEYLDESITVYNFEVADWHTYYVSEDEVLVHNMCPVGKKGDKTSTVKTLYHYTNEKGMTGIVESKKLNPSLKANNPKDARFGDGQYLSDIKPDNQTPVSLAQRFIHRPNRYKYTHYVEIDISDLEVIKGREGVYVIPNSEPLDLTDRIISTGSVGIQ